MRSEPDADRDEILALVGARGLGEVDRARDSRPDSFPRAGDSRLEAETSTLTVVVDWSAEPVQ